MQPRVDVGDVLGATFRTVFRNLGVYLATQGVFIFVASLLSLGLSLLVLAPGMEAVMRGVLEGNFDAVLAALGPILGGAFLVAVVGFFIQVASIAVGVAVTEALLDGRRPTLAEAWRRAAPRYGNLLLTSLLVGLAVLGVMLLGLVGVILILPLLAALAAVVYLLVRWAVVAPVSVFESNGPAENLARSSKLTEGERGSIFLTFLLYFLVIVGVGIVLSIPVSVVGGPFLEPGLGEEPTTPEEFLDAVGLSPGMQVLSWALQLVQQLAVGFLGSALVVILYRRLAAPPAAAEPAPPVQSVPWPDEPRAP